MPFDLATAKPLTAGGGGFDLATAKPVAQAETAGDQAAPSPWGFGGTLRERLLRPLAPIEVGTQAVTGAMAGPISGMAGLATGASNAIMRTFGATGPLPDPASVVQGVGRGMTYQPRTPLGQAASELVQYPFQKLNQGANYLGEKTTDITGSPAAGAAVNAGLQGTAQALIAKGLGSAASPVRGAGIIGERVPAGLQVGDRSMGAAASAAPSIAADASPQLQQAVERVAAKGVPINNEVLARKVEADSLPVKVTLTEGQATRDPVILSNERNMRANQPEFAKHFNTQEQQIVENLQAAREQAGPDVFSTNPVEHGDTLIRAYKDKAAVADRDIAGKYKALKDANGGQFPVDARALYRNAETALHENLLFDHAPPEVMRTLNRLASANNMTFENFEALRTNLARIQRSAADGNVKAAAGVIRNVMEELPLSRVQGRFAATEKLKPLADAARAAARRQFQALEADPAYNAAVNDLVPPDRFVQRYVVGAPRDAVAIMRKNFAGNETALQTMGVSAVDYLRQSAGLDSLGNGKLSQARFNKNLEALSPKLQELMGPQTADLMNRIGNVSRYIQEQPAGSFVNNSNTFTAAAGNAALKTAEGVANVAAGGVPVGSLGRYILEKTMAGKKAKNALAAEAGLDYPSNALPKVGQ